MLGQDPTLVAKNIIDYLGSANGGYIVAAAVLLTFLLSMMHICERGRIITVLFLGSCAWGTAFILSKLLGISVA